MASRNRKPRTKSTPATYATTAARSESPDWLRELRITKAHHHLAGSSSEAIDLNSIRATETPTIEFIRPEQHQFPLVLYKCSSPVGTCVTVKGWLETNLGSNIDTALQIVRMEKQNLHLIADPGASGTLILLDHAAYMPIGDGSTPVSIMALLIPQDKYIRFFYCILPFTPLLHTLGDTLDNDGQPFISFKRAVGAYTESTHSVSDGPDRHCRLFFLIRETFERALRVLIKRNFFAAYYTEIQRIDKKPGQRVRTEYASQQWLEREYGWVNRKAKRLAVGWRLLGLLDESRVMPWISEGGSLGPSMRRRVEEDDDNDNDDDEEGNVGNDGGGGGGNAAEVVAAAAQIEK